jgi:glycosyltransferase involved in cell wall biosynthesis
MRCRPTTIMRGAPVAMYRIDSHRQAERKRYSQHASGPLRVALIAPPWIPVPPPGYGGIEAVVALLADELVARGNEVTLFAAPGSRTRARVIAPLAEAHPKEIGVSLHEVDYVAQVFSMIDRAGAHGEAFDIVHDHSGFVTVAMADRIDAPVVHTLHAPFNAETRPFYERHGHKCTLIGISSYQREHAPPGVRVQAVVPNPLRVSEWPLRESKADYVLWMGRMDPSKGADRAIAAAREAGVPLILAGPVQPGQEEYFAQQVAPHLDERLVRYVGEVGGRLRAELFAGARAFLMPIRWPEPFGMVMVEALATGTPVIAFPEGAAREIVIDGVNGYLVEDESAMARAIRAAARIDPRRARASVAERFDARLVAAAYEDAYRRTLREIAAGAEGISARPARLGAQHRRMPKTAQVEGTAVFST